MDTVPRCRECRIAGSGLVSRVVSPCDVILADDAV